MTAEPVTAADFVADLAAVAARFGAALRDAGVPVGPERCARFARAIALLDVASTPVLYRCGLATLISHPDHIEIYDRVFGAVFGAELIADSNVEVVPAAGRVSQEAREPGDASVPAAEFPGLASAIEALSTRDFAALSPAELAALAQLMRRLAIATPPRRTRRYAPAPHGPRPDLRTTLRRARRTGGFPVTLARRRRRYRPRRLVVLCDISGSMEPYARALLQLLYCAAGGRTAEVFTFATRLTRLTRLLSRVPPDQMLAEAGRAAPDWSGGTRIGAALREFNKGYGLRGLARGAVILVISDGWETGDPALVGREMARLSRVAYRIVWANPRTASPRYEPRVAGMAAAWPYCDSVVSAHSLAALDDLLTALGR